jgi:hypothetical protein
MQVRSLPETLFARNEELTAFQERTSCDSHHRRHPATDWLLKPTPFLPPVETDNHTPYTRESYDKWRSPGGGYIEVGPISGARQCVAQIIGAFAYAIQAGKSRLAFDDLRKFSQTMRLGYGPP